MLIRYVHGDAFAGPERALAHGCNARGKFRRGFALAVRNRYPAAYAAYMRAFETDGLRVGEVITARCDPHVVLNVISQRDYGDPAKTGLVYVDYDGLAHAFRTVSGICRDNGIDAVAMPLIGASLAGGSWARIASVIEANSLTFTPVVYLMDGVVPPG